MNYILRKRVHVSAIETSQIFAFFIDIVHNIYYNIYKEMINVKTSNYNVRLNPEIKAEAEKTFAAFGMNLSEAINIFLHKSIMEHGLPFDVRTRVPNAETIALIESIEHGTERLYGPFSSIEEMNSALDAEDIAEDSLNA